MQKLAVAVASWDYVVQQGSGWEASPRISQMFLHGPTPSVATNIHLHHSERIDPHA